MKKSIKAMSAAGAVFLTIANPVNLLFVVLLFMAGFALFTEQIILVAMISTLALLTAALGATLLAIILLLIDKTLSSNAFDIFIGFAFVISLVIWSIEIFNTIPQYPWLYIVAMGAIMLICSLYLVPRLRDVFQSKGVMEL